MDITMILTLLLLSSNVNCYKLPTIDERVVCISIMEGRKLPIK